MPDPLLYLQAAIASLVSGMICMRVSGCFTQTESNDRRIGSILAIGLGTVCGFLVLRFQFVWPPVSALDRFLTILLPATFVIEVLASWPRIPPRLVQFVRFALIAISGRILLHGSAYLSPGGKEWTDGQLAMVLVLSALLLAGVWRLLLLLTDRAPDLSIPLSVALATHSAGVLVMMAGYLKGGAAAIPLAAALLGIAAASGWNRYRANLNGTIGIGILGLFCILFVGRLFGGLTTGTAVVVFVAPLLCWVAEIPRLRPKRPWQIVALRLSLVVIPLLVELTIAKGRFDRDMGPLLGINSTLQLDDAVRDQFPNIVTSKVLTAVVTSYIVGAEAATRLLYPATERPR